MRKITPRPWRKLAPAAPRTPFYPGPCRARKGVPVEQRFAHIEAIGGGGPDRAGAVRPGSFNVSVPGADGAFAPTQLVIANDMHDSYSLCRSRRRLQTGGLSISIFGTGFVKFIIGAAPRRRVAAGGILKFYFGADDPAVRPCRHRHRARCLSRDDRLAAACLGWSPALAIDCVGCGLAEARSGAGRSCPGRHRTLWRPAHPEKNVELVEEAWCWPGDWGRPIATPAQAAAYHEPAQLPGPLLVSAERRSTGSGTGWE